MIVLKKWKNRVTTLITRFVAEWRDGGSENRILLSSFVWGGFWLAVILVVRPLFGEFDLNEMGDSLAGFVAPVAFIWLIVGYRQQAHMIALQAKELKATVEEQRKIVEASKIQIEIDRRRRDHEALALFLPKCTKHTGLEQGGRIPELAFEVAPSRNCAYEIKVLRSDGSQANWKKFRQPGEPIKWTEKDIPAREIIKHGMTYTITYRDIDGQQRSEGIDFYVNKANLGEGVSGGNSGPDRERKRSDAD